MDLLSALGQGVGAVGEGLDKFTGGRAMRGLAAGHAREGLSFLPFSDTMGLTDENEKQSGRDVTNAWGVTGKDDDGFGAKALGFGADMLLNPANIAGGIGAFGAAGRGIKGLGAAAKAMSGADLLEGVASGGANLAGKAAKAWAPSAADASMVGSLGKAASTGSKAAEGASSLAGAADTTWGLNSMGNASRNSGEGRSLLDALRNPTEKFINAEGGYFDPEGLFNGIQGVKSKLFGAGGEAGGIGEDAALAMAQDAKFTRPTMKGLLPEGYTPDPRVISEAQHGATKVAGARQWPGSGAPSAPAGPGRSLLEALHTAPTEVPMAAPSAPMGLESVRSMEPEILADLHRFSQMGAQPKSGVPPQIISLLEAFGQNPMAVKAGGLGLTGAGIGAWMHGIHQDAAQARQQQQDQLFQALLAQSAMQGALGPMGGVPAL